MNIDICVLQEIGNCKEEDLRAIFSNGHITTHNNEGTAHRSGLATISNLDLVPTNAVTIDLPQITGWQAKMFERIYKTLPQHSAILTTYEVSGRKVTVANVHLDVFGGTELKTRQMEKLKEAIEESGAEAVIIMGDFNTGFEVVSEELLPTLGEEYRLHGNPKDVTLCVENTMSSVIPMHKTMYKLLKLTRLGKLIRKRTDWIITKGIAPIEEGVDSTHKGSDHYPIYIAF